MAMSKRCLVTGLSVSYAYKMGCRCSECRAQKAVYTANDRQAADRVRRWKRENPERARKLEAKAKRKRQLKGRYGLDVSTYETLRAGQQGQCAICGRGPEAAVMSSSRAFLQIDHDHETGVVRGLLCGNCNVALGHFGDNVEHLQRAIQYLQRSQNGDV